MSCWEVYGIPCAEFECARQCLRVNWLRNPLAYKLAEREREWAERQCCQRAHILQKINLVPMSIADTGAQTHTHISKYRWRWRYPKRYLTLNAKYNNFLFASLALRLLFLRMIGITKWWALSNGIVFSEHRDEFLVFIGYIIRYEFVFLPTLLGSLFRPSCTLSVCVSICCFGLILTRAKHIAA